MQSLAYLARQPILDRDGNIFAYELLFRDSPSSDTAIIASDLQATAQVLENILNSIGLTRLVGESKAFINCSGITSVTIPNSVKYIEWDAFNGCSGLRSIVIGNHFQ